VSNQVKVKVPATTANLGPGFDALGLALSLFNTVEVAESERLNIEIEGEGAHQLPRDETNFVVIAVNEVFKAVGKGKRPLSIRLHNNIPLARGLGSSAAARVGAMVAANHLCGAVLSRMELLALATKLEGHPDNVAPAMLGGLVISAVEDDGSVQCVQLPLAKPPALVLLIPDIEVPTEKARSVLPDTYSRQEACFNISRAALLVGAMVTGRHDLLRVGLQDKIHQPFRAQIMPWFDAVVEAAINSGAYGAVLSGAGSSILAMTPEGCKDSVGTAMLETLKQCGQTGRYLSLEVDTGGACIID